MKLIITFLTIVFMNFGALGSSICEIKYADVLKNYLNEKNLPTYDKLDLNDKKQEEAFLKAQKRSDVLYKLYAVDKVVKNKCKKEDNLFIKSVTSFEMMRKLEITEYDLRWAHESFILKNCNNDKKIRDKFLILDKKIIKKSEALIVSFINCTYQPKTNVN